MKKRWRLGMLLTLLLLLGVQMTALAANEKTILYAYIEGDQVIVHAVGPAVASDDGQYYLFALKTWEDGIGARTDFCATAAENGEVISFMTPLQLDTAASKLYSRFVVAVKSGGKFVPVSTEMYITNPEAVAQHSTTSIAEATGNKKGLFSSWTVADHLSDLGAGYVATMVNTANWFSGNDFPYTYNGKTFYFNGFWVNATDNLVKIYQAQNVDIVMMLVNGPNPGTMDMMYPEAVWSIGNPEHEAHYYAVNMDSQVSEEKFEAWVSFIADRYSGGFNGSIHNYIIGNEVNSSKWWHYAGDVSVEEFSRRYAEQFRVAYNAIKSHNSGANVYMCTDQRWTHKDNVIGGGSYGGKDVINMFTAEIAKTGNINWGLSFHPYPTPLWHTKFWTPGPYASLKLVNHTENTKIIIPTNMDVVINYMMKPGFLAPDQYGNPTDKVRNLFVSELGFSSKDRNDPSVNEAYQAAAMAYAYKLIQSNPYIKGVTFNGMMDDEYEIAQNLAYGLLDINKNPKLAYSVFKNMDKLGMEEWLPYIGATSWEQLIK